MVTQKSKGQGSPAKWEALTQGPGAAASCCLWEACYELLWAAWALLKLGVPQAEGKLFKKFLHWVVLGGWGTCVPQTQPCVRFSNIPIPPPPGGQRSLLSRGTEVMILRSTLVPSFLSSPSLSLPVCLLTWVKSSSLSSVSPVHGWLAAFLLKYPCSSF